MRYHFLRTRRAIIKKITGIRKDVEKLEPLYVTSGDVNWCACYRKQYGGDLNKLAYDPAILLMDIYPKALKAKTQNRYLITNIHRSIIRNSQKVETIQMAKD